MTSTGQYAVGLTELDSGIELSVLDAETGNTIRHFEMLDFAASIRSCQPLKPLDATPTTTIVCWFRETGGTTDTRAAIVDLELGKVRLSEVDGQTYAVAGGRAVLSTSDVLWVGAANAYNSADDWEHSTWSPADFVPVNGSAVVAQATGAAVYLRSTATGETVHDLALDTLVRDGTDWQEFAEGFASVIREGKTTGHDHGTQDSTIVFYDPQGRQTAELVGPYTLMRYSHRRPMVTSVPIVLGNGFIAAVDPATGKLLWQREISDSPQTMTGMGTKVIVNYYLGGFAWFDCYDGTGGEIAAPAGEDIRPIGTDGTNIAVVTTPKTDSEGPQVLAAYAPDSDEPLWTMPLPDNDGHSTPVTANGQLYAGGNTEFGDRRLL